MHRTEGPDHAANLYSESSPATVINANAMNAIQEEIARAVVESGQTLAASGAADLAAGWVQLREAIKRLPLVQPVDATLTAVSGAATNMTPALGINFIRLERSGGLASPGEEFIFPNNVAYNGRIITLFNCASMFAQIKDRRGCLTLMAMHTCEQFYCFLDDDGVNYNWAPMTGVYSGSVVTTADYTDPVSSHAVTLYFQKRGLKIDLYLPFLGITIDGGPTNIVTIALPPFLHGQNNSRPKILLSDGTTVPVWTTGSFPSGGPGGGDLNIGGILSTSHELEAQWVSYLADNESVA